MRERMPDSSLGRATATDALPPFRQPRTKIGFRFE